MFINKNRCVILLVSLATLVLGCSGGKKTVAKPPIVASKFKVKQSPVKVKLDWVLAVINKDKAIPNEEEYSNHFSPSFLEAVPPSQLSALFKQFQLGLAPVAIDKRVSKEEQNQMQVHVTTAQESLKVSITVDPTTPHHITGLLFAPIAKSNLKQLQSMNEVEVAIKTGVESSQVYAAEVVNKKCQAFYEYNTEAPLALGSTFKLWVLSALLDAIEKGALEWNSTLVVKELWRVFSAGAYKGEDKNQSVKNLAEKMISVSDNTATDVLFYTLGREKIEKVMGRFVDNPSLPMMSTRELFISKISMNEKERATFVKSKLKQKRKRLNAMSGEPLPELKDVMAWGKPIDIDKIEWFAKPHEICQTLVSLHDRGQIKKLEPVLDILSKNRGIGIDPKRFPWVGFKGGSEPGVMYLAFLVKRNDGKLFSVITAQNDTEKLINDAELVHATEQALRLVGQRE